MVAGEPQRLLGGDVAVYLHITGRPSIRPRRFVGRDQAAPAEPKGPVEGGARPVRDRRQDCRFASRRRSAGGGRPARVARSRSRTTGTARPMSTPNPSRRAKETPRLPSPRPCGKLGSPNAEVLFLPFRHERQVRRLGPGFECDFRVAAVPISSCSSCSPTARWLSDVQRNMRRLMLTPQRSICRLSVSTTPRLISSVNGCVEASLS